MDFGYRVENRVTGFDYHQLEALYTLPIIPSPKSNNRRTSKIKTDGKTPTT